MSKPQRRPILNSSLPAQFRQIRIVLAREPGHPDGDDEVSYIFVAPVDAEGRINQNLWRAHREACRVARHRPNEEDQLGHLVHHAGGAWGFHYDVETQLPDDVGFHFADERFVALAQVPPAMPSEFAPDMDTARQTVTAAIVDGRQWLDPVEIKRLLEAYGIAMVPTFAAADADSAVAHASKGSCSTSPGQCDISTGTVIDSNTPRVTPPRIRSFNRE